MKREQLIECIYIGFKDGLTDRINEDNEDYEECDPTELPISGDEAQYAYEFGIMAAREYMEIDDNLMDEYLEEILFEKQRRLVRYGCDIEC